MAREHWGSRVGFILAAAGSAVGLGNIWRFPNMIADNGGAAALFIYLFIVIFIGGALMLTEIGIGRMAQTNAVTAYSKTGGKKWWGIVGGVGILCAFITLSYYVVIAGWALKYAESYITGDLFSHVTAVGDFAKVFKHYIGTTNEPIVYSAIFLGMTAFVVIGGIGKGIELANLILMPLLLVLMIGLVVWVLFLPGSAAGVRYYLSPDFSQVTSQTFIKALGQAFFSLSLGFGSLMTYGSYLHKKANMRVATANIIAADTSIALLAGFLTIPLLFVYGLKIESGGGLAFIALPTAFSQMPFGSIFGFAFFALLVIAALTSAMSLLEPLVAWVTEVLSIQRTPAVIILSLLAFAASVPSSLSQGAVPITIDGKSFLDAMDGFINLWGLPLSALGMAIFGGWVISDKMKHELSNGGSHAFPAVGVWLFLMRFVVPVAIIVIVVSQLPIVMTGITAVFHFIGW